MTAPSILFVCLGNICRSPMAEGAMRAELARLGLEWDVDSAGTADYHVGKAPDPRAVACAQRHGVDISRLRARQVVAEDFSRWTHIFALDQANFNDLAALRAGGAKAELHLLLDLVEGGAGQAVADPYYRGEDAFETTWRVVTAAARSICEKLAG